MRRLLKLEAYTGTVICIITFLVLSQAVFLFPKNALATTEVNLMAQGFAHNVLLNWYVSGGTTQIDSFVILKSTDPDPMMPPGPNDETFELNDPTAQFYNWQKNIQGSEIYFFRVCLVDNNVCAVPSNVERVAITPNVGFIQPSQYTQLSGTETIKIKTNFEAEVVEFNIYGPPLEEFTGNYEGNFIYSFDWDTITYPDGNYEITAYAYEPITYDIYSADINVETNNGQFVAPQINIDFIDLKAGDELFDNAMLKSQVTLYGQEIEDALVKYDIYQASNNHLESSIGAIYEDGYYWAVWETPTVNDGSYRIEAEASGSGYLTKTIDAVVNVSNSEYSSFNIDIVSPQGGEVISSGTNVPIKVAVSSNLVMVNIDIFKEGSLLSSTVGQSVNNEYNYSWDTNGLAGDFHIKVRSNLENIVRFDEVAVSVVSDTPPSQEDDSNATSTPLATSTDKIINDITQIDPADYGVHFIESPSETNAPLTISAQTNFIPETINFRVIGAHGRQYEGIAAQADTYYFEWPEPGFPFGEYNIEVTATLSGQQYEDSFFINYTPYLSETDEEIITDDFVINFMGLESMVISTEQTIVATANKPLSSVSFEVSGEKSRAFSGHRIDEYQYSFLLNPEEYPSGDYLIQVNGLDKEYREATNKIDVEIINISESTSEDATEDQLTNRLATTTTQVKETLPLDPGCLLENIVNQTECQLFLALPSICHNQGITNSQECADYLGLAWECQEKGLDRNNCQQYLLLDFICRQNNITNIQDCQNFLYLSNIPTRCQAAGITTHRECEVYQASIKLPDECKNADIKTDIECEKFLARARLLPSECQAVGIISIEACERYRFIKSSSAAMSEIPPLPQECQGDNALAKPVCQEYFTNYLPLECQAIGIKNVLQCRTYLGKKYISAECKKAGAVVALECNEYYLNKQADQECETAGISENKECQSYLMNRIASQLICQDSRTWECEQAIKKRHLGSIINRQKKYRSIEELKRQSEKLAIPIKELLTILEEDKDIIPIPAAEVSVNVVAATETITLKANEDIIHTSPIILIIDNDSDGLSDDMEKRLGTDPLNNDTDGDGFSDLEELTRGYNPMGVGVMRVSARSGVEKALLEKLPLEHPKIKGRIDSTYTIKGVSNINNQAKSDANTSARDILNQAGYNISGTAEPNQIVTLYIYSDIPIVMTVKTDEYGNWRYQFTNALSDGEHEVYVALNDDSGRVIKKSQPLSIFIKEAQAVGIDDFVAPTSFESATPTESMIDLYMVVAVLVMIGGILLFITFFLILKNRHP